MTLKELRSKCLLAIRQHVTTTLLPDQDGAVRSAVRKTVRYLEGMKRKDTITSVSGTAAYDLATDFMSVRGVHDDTNNKWLEKITFTQKLFNTTGVPDEYYIEAKQIRFDRTPDGAYTYTMWYLGYGDNVTGDDDDILDEYFLNDDDPLWQAIIHQFAFDFWDKKIADAELAGDVKLINIGIAAQNRHNQRALVMRNEFKIQLDKENRDQAPQVALPGDFFVTNDSYLRLDHDRVVRRR